jgi:predicted metal-dependent phosphotriesterase family hydrolase
MPTIDAGYHAEIYGYTGSYDRQKGTTSGESEGIRILKDGNLTPEIQEVIRLVAEHGANLGTSHLSPEEIRALVEEARKVGVEKILIMHPLFKVPRLPMSIIEEVVKLGALLEIDYCGISPMWAEVKLDDLVQLIKTFGSEHCILVSDAGQTHNPIPCDALRLLAQNLHEKGVTEKELERMMVTTPKQLLEI